MDGRIKEVVCRAIEDAGRYPFLFVGSGLSRRYMGAPDWEGLLSTVCAEICRDPYAYAGYKNRAAVAVRNGETDAALPYAATLMEEEIDRSLFSDARFRDFRERHDSDLRSGASPMKLYISEVISRYELNRSGETELLMRAGEQKVSGVITTNYDRMCELLLPDFSTFVGEDDLLFSDQAYAQEIYKIHGSVAEPRGLVLTSADYCEFARRRKYLSAKLLTMFVEYPVIFLGYSIQDANIRSILGDICECLPEDKLARLGRRLIFIQYERETSIGEFIMDFNGKALSMTKIATNDFESVYEAILSSRKLYSTKLLRELRGSVFSLIEKIDPSSDIVVSGVDNVLNNLAPDQKIVVGLSVSRSGIGRPISAEDIFEDVVLDNLRYDPRLIVEDHLNRLVRRYPNCMPVFKYVRDLGGKVGKDIAEYLPKLDSLEAFRNNTISKRMPAFRSRYASSLSIKGLVGICGVDSVFKFIPYLEEDEIDVGDLEALLKDSLAGSSDGSETRKGLLKDSNYRKCVRIYDFLRYGHKEAPQPSPIV